MCRRSQRPISACSVPPFYIGKHPWSLTLEGLSVNGTEKAVGESWAQIPRRNKKWGWDPWDQCLVLPGTEVCICVCSLSILPGVQIGDKWDGDQGLEHALKVAFSKLELLGIQGKWRRIGRRMLAFSMVRTWKDKWKSKAGEKEIKSKNPKVPRCLLPAWDGIHIPRVDPLININRGKQRGVTVLVTGRKVHLDWNKTTLRTQTVIDNGRHLGGYQSQNRSPRSQLGGLGFREPKHWTEKARQTLSHLVEDNRENCQ